MRSAGTGSPRVAANLAAAGANSPAAATARKTAAVGHGAAAPAIASAAAVTEAMAAPAVLIAPAGPWAHAQEDAVVKVPRPVKSIGRAVVRSIVVIAIGTDRLNAYIDNNLRLSRRRQGHAHNQSCTSEKCFESVHK
jgi:hypothetical protein